MSVVGFDLRDPLVAQAAREVDALLPGTALIGPADVRHMTILPEGVRYLEATDEYLFKSGHRVGRVVVELRGWTGIIAWAERRGSR